MKRSFAGLGIGLGIGAVVILLVLILSGGEVAVALLGQIANMVSFGIIGMISMWKIPWFKNNAIQGMALTLLFYLPNMAGSIANSAYYLPESLMNTILGNLLMLAIFMAAGALIGFLCGKARKEN